MLTLGRRLGSFNQKSLDAATPSDQTSRAKYGGGGDYDATSSSKRRAQRLKY
jgi:hypothetical protein